MMRNCDGFMALNRAKEMNRTINIIVNACTTRPIWHRYTLHGSNLRDAANRNVPNRSAKIRWPALIAKRPPGEKRIKDAFSKI
jgi:hypothetical protein